ncbi:MAG: CorA family divalent cation transporter [Candidatus Izemoplasmataceae bacterium]
MHIKDYFLPKSFIYTGKHATVPTKIIHYGYDEEDVKTSHAFDDLDASKHYIQVIGLKDTEKITEALKAFNIDEMVIEDIFNVTQRPKIEVKKDYIFGVFRIVYKDHEKINHDYMSLIMKDHLLITFHETTPLFLEAVPPLFKRNSLFKREGSDHLLFHLLDIMTDKQIDLFDEFKDKLEGFEASILENKKSDQEAFYLVRKELLTLKNNVSPMLESLEKTVYENPLFKRDTLHYYDDLLDHLKRLESNINEARELMRHLLDLEMNNQSNQMNRIMKTLTLFSAIFIPLSFLTGFFGMNFIHFNILAYEEAVPLFLGFSILIAVLMIVLFKKMKWF